MKILLTGANGYIGMRLIPELISQGHQVVCAVRNTKRFPAEVKERKGVTAVEADFLDAPSLSHLPDHIDAAFYLIHSMAGQTGNFQELEETMARNFVNYIDQTSAKQIIYLTGIVNQGPTSEHFASRLATEEILKQSKVPLTALRAAIIVGSGSASFEIIRDLVEKLPIMVAPRWLNSKCQPIGVRDVMTYLTSSIGHPPMYGRSVDIGGPEVLTYKDMLLQYAEVRGLKRYILTLPLLTPRLSSLWLYFVTSTSIHLARNLVDSMKYDVVMTNHHIQSLIPHEPMTYRESVRLAFLRVSQNAVLSSWKDAASSSGTHLTDPDEYSEVPTYGCFHDQQVVPLKVSVEQGLDNIWRIGGLRGYYYATFLWKLRGYLDKLVGGIGLRRGRRSPTDINPGDALDFWRVLVSDKKQRRLLLYAEMKLPGEAWLEFSIKEKEEGHVLSQRATFRPKGLFGRLYWYAVWPFHIFVFGGMAKRMSAYTASDAKAHQTVRAERP